MKSAIAKGALALSVLGFSFGSTVVFDSQWAPNIFRTVANAITNVGLTTESIGAELTSYNQTRIELKEELASIREAIDSNDSSLSVLIKIRDEKVKTVQSKLDSNSSRRADFSDFLSTNPEHELKEELTALTLENTLRPISEDELSNLTDNILQAQESELLEQKAALAVTNEKICKNTGLLQDIKSQIAELLKDKKQIVEIVENEEEKKEEVQSDFTTRIATFSSYMAEVQAQQRAMFQLSPPAYLGPNNNMSMLMMMNMMKQMNDRQFNTPFHDSSPYFNRGFSSFPSAFGGYEISSRNPVVSNFFESDFRQRHTMDEYTLKVPTVERGEGLKGSFTF